MNLKLSLTSLRRRTLMLVVVIAMSIAMLPTAAFASGYGHQGRAWDPGPRQQRGEHRPKRDDDNKDWNNKGGNWNNNQNNGNQYNRPNQCNVTYRVKRGDSLSEIARKYGVSVNQLAKANGINNPNRIVAGQVLCIPC